MSALPAYDGADGRWGSSVRAPASPDSRNHQRLTLSKVNPHLSRWHDGKKDRYDVLEVPLCSYFNILCFHNMKDSVNSTLTTN